MLEARKSCFSKASGFRAYRGEGFGLWVFVSLGFGFFCIRGVCGFFSGFKMGLIRHLELVKTVCGGLDSSSAAKQERSHNGDCR